MDYYIIFGTDCQTCFTLASDIEKAAHGKVKAISIESQKAQELLQKAFPKGHTI